MSLPAIDTHQALRERGEATGARSRSDFCNMAF